MNFSGANGWRNIVSNGPENSDWSQTFIRSRTWRFAHLADGISVSRGDNQH